MSPEQAPGVPQFQFTALAVTKAHFEMLPTAVSNAPRPAKLNVGLQIGASIGTGVRSGPHHAFITLETVIIPDEAFQPYRIEVTVSGAFSTDNGSQTELLSFCKLAAPSILFPYIRETVHRLTMDAPHGAVRLDPVNISQLLNATEWEIKSADGINVPSSTEPVQPSAQSPSSEQK
jgi:preprotein translocase subunit SecB